MLRELHSSVIRTNICVRYIHAAHSIYEYVAIECESLF